MNNKSVKQVDGCEIFELVDVNIDTNASYPFVYEKDDDDDEGDIEYEDDENEYIEEEDMDDEEDDY